jgi:hypothetical protein
VGLRDRLKKLEREAEGEMLVIPQRDGSPARFPASAAKDAFINLMNRLGVGEDAPPEHPLIGAIRNSTDPLRMNGGCWLVRRGFSALVATVPILLMWRSCLPSTTSRGAGEA